MKVVVGSQNPVKIEATRQAFVMYFGDDVDIEVIGMIIESDVSEQPMTVTETAQGAYNRAKNLCGKVPDADYVVGIEGGLGNIELKQQTYAMEQSWACVWHCKTDKHEIAGTPAFPILSNVMKQIEGGKDLSTAMEIEYGLQDLGKNEGYIGWLTDKVMDRTSYSVSAIFIALCSLHKEK